MTDTLNKATVGGLVRDLRHSLTGLDATVSALEDLADAEPPSYVTGQRETFEDGKVAAEDVVPELEDIAHTLAMAMQVIHEERRACNESGVVFPPGVDQASGALQLCLDGLNHEIADLRREAAKAERAAKPAA